MQRRSSRSVLTLLVTLLALTFAGPTLAQRGGDEDGPRMTREQWQNMSDEEREAFREQMRERMAERQAERETQVREALDMSEDEWELIGPKIAAIRQMQREQQMVSGGGGFGGRGGPAGPGNRDRGGDEGGDNPRGGDRGGPELSEQAVAIQTASAELRELLEDDGASGSEIKEALGDLRKARKAMNDAIDNAQEDLRGLLTTRQEAMLVAQGVLE